MDKCSRPFLIRCRKKCWPNILLLIFLLGGGSMLGSCGDDSDNSGGLVPGILAISFESPTSSGTYVLGASQPSVPVSGSVSESPYGKVQESVCNCAGWACFFDSNCVTMYFSRVGVTVRNIQTGQVINGSLSNDSYSSGQSSYFWNATVDLVPGDNQLIASASDGLGYAGTATITIRNP